MKTLIGTFFLTGLSPFAPATVTSLFALVFPLFFWRYPSFYLFLTIFVLFLGVKLAADLERIWGKDARRITIDEVLGILITFLLIAPINWKVLLFGFVFFRVFDIGKLPFIRESQKLEGGWGVMLDDLFAGVLANLSLRFLIFMGVR